MYRRVLSACERLVLINGGRLAFDGTVADLRAAHHGGRPRSCSASRPLRGRRWLSAPA
jgi:ABC-type uncharacterized transport system ATPase subunit